ncbi:hypothetical protein C8Q77DRAFT_1173096 [Trametes polyzona]|nr:hypothetical protein C8Q77DRAFT_1173096 [Trametes polyzona]
MASFDPRRHPLWSIPEVVREVMKQLADNPHSLAQCTLVSRIFSDAALEVLWENQPSLGRLFSLLPTSVQKASMRNENDGDDMPDFDPSGYVLCDTIRDTEWARLEHYARLVRSLVSDGERIDGLTAAALLEKLNGQSLLPRLKTLTWRNPSYLSAAFPILISPMLESVTLDLLEGGMARFAHSRLNRPSATEYAYGIALRVLRTRAPQVRHVSLVTSVFPCSLGGLRDWDSIEHLEVHQVLNPGLVLDVCSSLPLLHTLFLECINARDDEGEELSAIAPLPEVTLPHLRTLRLMGRPDKIVVVLAAIHAPVTLFDLWMDVKNDIWRRCMELAAARFKDTLREFDAFVDLPTHGPFTSYPFGPMFSPLYAVRGLEIVRISSHHMESYCQIGERDVEELAAAWSGLRQLVLQLLDAERPLTVSLTSVAALAEKCRKLENLVFPVPNEESLFGLSDAHVTTPNPSVQKAVLVTVPLPLESRRQCVDYLKRLFPSIKTVKFVVDLDDEETEDDAEDDDEDMMVASTCMPRCVILEMPNVYDPDIYTM